MIKEMAVFIKEEINYFNEIEKDDYKYPALKRDWLLDSETVTKIEEENFEDFCGTEAGFSITTEQENDGVTNVLESHTKTENDVAFYKIPALSMLLEDCRKKSPEQYTYGEGEEQNHLKDHRQSPQQDSGTGPGEGEEQNHLKDHRKSPEQYTYGEGEEQNHMKDHRKSPEHYTYGEDEEQNHLKNHRQSPHQDSGTGPGKGEEQNDVRGMSLPQSGYIQEGEGLEEDRTFTCSMCDYTCAYKSTLESHSKIHTRVRPYSCTVCDHKSARSSDLIQHMRTHTYEKPYMCDVCDFRCSDPSSMSKHKKIHTNVRPFKCDMCDYKCARLCKLTQHERIHTEEKPYKCRICDYRSAYTSNMSRHKKKHV